MGWRETGPQPLGGRPPVSGHGWTFSVDQGWLTAAPHGCESAARAPGAATASAISPSAATTVRRSEGEDNSGGEKRPCIRQKVRDSERSAMEFEEFRNAGSR